MKTSEFNNVSEAINAAVDRSRNNDEKVTLWVDDSTIDEAIDAIRTDIYPTSDDADWELVSDNHVDAWGNDWRVIIRVGHPDFSPAVGQ